MTAKEFFKSNAFKCLVTLLAVLLVSGMLLGIAYGFLEVTDEEKFNRKVGNLYPDGSSVTPTLVVDAETKLSYSTVEKVWYIPEKGDYLVQVYGNGRDGKITVWAIINVTDNAVSGVGTVLVYDKIDSEYAYKIPGWNTNISNFEKDYVDGIKYDYGNINSSSYLSTGASVSFTAISRCVNDAITYIQASVSGEVIEGPPFEDYLYNDNIDQNETSVSVNGNEVTYNIKTLGLDEAGAFTIEIVVDGDKKIKSFAYVGEDGNGSTEGYDEAMPDLESILVGRDISYFTGKYGEEMEYRAIADYDDNDVTTGATDDGIASKSTYLCMCAGAFATANYEKALASGGVN